MKPKPHSLLLIYLLLATVPMTSCGLFISYRDVRTKMVYRSNEGVKNYFTIKATTLYHCGCTWIYVDHFFKGKKKFQLFYDNKVARKTVYQRDKKTGELKAIKLQATTEDNFTVPFDATDMEAFRQINILARERPKGIVYGLNETAYKGFIRTNW